MIIAIKQTLDGGYIVAGNTSLGAGGADGWLLKTDKDGVITWQKSYGGGENDYFYAVVQNSDGSYVAAGLTNSCCVGSEDAWLVKVDGGGNIIWQKTYGGASLDIAFALAGTSDGGYILAGLTQSFGAGGYDMWVLKLDQAGAITWQKTYGGTGYDRAEAVSVTGDGGYLVTGYTGSFGAGGYDVWLLKLDQTGAVTWQKTYGGSNNEYAYAVLTWVSREIRGMDTLSMCRISREKMGINSNS